MIKTKMIKTKGDIVNTMTLKTIDLRDNSKNPEGYARFASNTPISSFESKSAKNGKNKGIVTGYRNNITVVDLDFYTKGDKIYDPHSCTFIKEFGSDYVNRFDTYTVMTPNGGHHLYFKYDPDIKQYQGGNERVDIRNDGGYIVAPYSTIDSKMYEPIRDVEIKEIPSDLREWLLNMMKKTDRSEKVRNVNAKVKDIDVDEDDGTTYSYNISRDEFEKIANKLPSSYWINFYEWFVFTSSARILGYRDIWDNINKTKPGYDGDNNINMWNAVDISHAYVIDRILIDSNNKHFIDYCKYKPIPKNVIKPSKTINCEKLGYDFFKCRYNYIVKSDTGTGKTTSFKHYVCTTEKPFISIVSRISLAESHYRDLADTRDIVKYYEMQNDFEYGDSIVIQLDSIKYLTKLHTFKGYIIFYDEFNSIVEHLITSPTLAKSRVLIMAFIYQIILQCDQFIGVDADISDTCINFLNGITNKYKYIENTHNHNKNTPATEIFEYDDMIEKMKNEDKFLCACDSAIEAHRIYDILKIYDNTIQLYTAETRNTNKDDGRVYLDGHNKVIFSPRVIYGLDSITPRSVYCMYKEHTISPFAMMQQLNRGRNITHLYYLFTYKTFIRVLRTMHDIRVELENTDKYGQLNFKMSSDNLLKEKYMNILSEYEYRNECFRSNKYAHFIKLLDERGFNRNTSALETNFTNMTQDEKDKKHNTQVMEFESKTAYNMRINNILKIPDAIIGEFVEYFINPIKLAKHFLFCDIFLKDKCVIIANIEESGDFKVNKARSEKAKILFINTFREKCGIVDQFDIMIKYMPCDEDRMKLLDEYKMLFRHRGDTATFANVNELQIYLIRIIKQLLNKDVIKTIRTMNKGNRIIKYFIDPEYIEANKLLFEFRHPAKIPKKILKNINMKKTTTKNKL